MPSQYRCIGAKQIDESRRQTNRCVGQMAVDALRSGSKRQEHTWIVQQPSPSTPNSTQQNANSHNGNDAMGALCETHRYSGRSTTTKPQKNGAEEADIRHTESNNNHAKDRSQYTQTATWHTKSVDRTRTQQVRLGDWSSNDRSTTPNKPTTHAHPATQRGRVKRRNKRRQAGISPVQLALGSRLMVSVGNG